MKNVITRHCINPEILLHEHDTDTGELVKVYDYNEFCDLINRWKIILIEKYNVQPGQTIFLRAGPNLRYYSLLFAAAELGLIFIVDWPHVHTERDLHDPKVIIHGSIDYSFLLRSQHDLDHPNCRISPWEIQRDLKFVKTFLYDEDFYEHDIQHSKLINSVADIIWANSDSDLIHSTSSGTTGFPKKIINSHKKVYLMARRLANHYFRKNDSALHTDTMNHGASLCYHFLPAFMMGGKQFTAAGVNYTGVDSLIKFAVDNRINQLLLYLPATLTYFLQNMPRVDHCFNIVTLYQIMPNLVPLIKEKNINWIKSPFGDTTIGMGFFIKTVDQTTTSVGYDVTNMGPTVDDFFQIELRDNRLYISCPELELDWKTSDDLFELINENYYFKGRANNYRINGEWIQLCELENKVKELFGTDASIVVDPDLQRIYLAIWKNNPAAEIELSRFFDKNYKLVNISYVLRDGNYDHFFNSRKIDNSKLRQVCREKLKLTEMEGVK
jgi:acyl-CoA synthetase (AMP-forming)/AMP-acid ligase II